MLSTIHLNHQSRLQAYKFNRVGPNYSLPPKFESRQLPHP